MPVASARRRTHKERAETDQRPATKPFRSTQMAEENADVRAEDAPPPAEADVEAEAPPAPPENPRFSVPVHSLIEAARADHGLGTASSASGAGTGGGGPSGDHRSYRKYCSRRLGRLRRDREVRKELSHGAAGGKGGGGGGDKQQQEKKKKGKKGGGGQQRKGGRHAFQARPQGEYAATSHVNYALVSLTGAERCWAHAMEIKEAYDEAREVRRTGKAAAKKKTAPPVAAAGASSLPSTSSPANLRRFYLRRLKKAAAYASELEGRARVSCDDRTVLETRAYAGWMKGSLGLEVGDFQRACAEFGSALAICRALGSGEATDGAAAASQSPSSAAEVLELRDFFTARADHVLEPLVRYCQYELQEGGMDQEALDSLVRVQEDYAGTQLRSKLDSLRDEKRLTEASGGSSMATVKFRSREVPVESQELRFGLLKIADLRAELEMDPDNEGKFLSLLSLLDDATSLVSADLREYESMKSGPAVNAKRFEAQSLLGYTKHEKLKLLMARNERMVDGLRAELEGEKGGGGGGTNAEGKGLEQIAHLYDALLQDARSVAQLPGGSPDGDAEEEEFVLEANANVLRLRALRCYYVAQMYGLEEMGRYANAVALFDQASLLSSRASEEIGACQDMDAGLIEAMERLEVRIGAARSRAVANAYLAKTGGRSPGSGGDGAGGTVGHASLLRRLDDFEVGYNSNGRYVDVPPAPEPITCKPAFFDLAFGYVSELPVDELQRHVDELEQEQEQGTAGGILGWLRGG